MELLASSTRFENDGECTVLAFADAPLEPKDFVVLSMTNSPSPQDVKLGMGGIHLEVGGRSFDGYALVRDIELIDKGVCLLLDDEAATKAGVDRRILITLVSPLIDGLTAVQAIEPFRERIASQR